MFNVSLAGCHLYGKQLFTWLSLVVSLMASFVLSFFPLDVLDEIWDLIESVIYGHAPAGETECGLSHRTGRPHSGALCYFCLIQATPMCTYIIKK